jgi:hypothetical protein
MTASVRTAADHPDPTLRGRTYPVPFVDVWFAAVELAGGGLPGWTIIAADDQAGSIHAVSVSFLFRTPRDVHLRIVLDENAQTRVDASAGRRGGGADLGVARRRLRQFFRRLDVQAPRAWASRIRGSRDARARATQKP